MQLMPPGAPKPGAPAVSVSVSTLKKRKDFLRASRAHWLGTSAFHLQARERALGEADGIRVGFTCSKKVGNAVARNRAKRRLREAARLLLASQGRDGWDYVLIGRKDITASVPFDRLLADLTRALTKVHQ